MGHRAHQQLKSRPQKHEASAQGIGGTVDSRKGVDSLACTRTLHFLQETRRLVPSSSR